MNQSKRQFIQALLFGGGLYGLKSLATGLPVNWFTPGSPRALAATNTPAQFLIMSASQGGDAINANCPGSYGVAGVYNNPNSSMAAVSVSLGGKNFQAASPWGNLPAWALDRSCFFHHRTYSNVHAGHTKVMTLMGSAKNKLGNANEAIYSVYAEALSEKLSTIQREPVALGAKNSAEALVYQGRSLQSISPRTLRETFASPAGELKDLAALRDKELDRLHHELKSQGTYAQRLFVERYALSRSEVKSINADLLDRLSSLNDDGIKAQLSSASTLIMMKVAPVFTVHLNFGGDNHADLGLIEEANETISTLSDLGQFLEDLKTSQLEDQVTLANLNVFGRTLGKIKDGNGRDHNQHHHVMMSIGKGVRAGVIGGIVTAGVDYGASDIDSQSGAAQTGGDIPSGESRAKALPQGLWLKFRGSRATDKGTRSLRRRVKERL